MSIENPNRGEGREATEEELATAKELIKGTDLEHDDMILGLIENKGFSVPLNKFIDIGDFLADRLEGKKSTEIKSTAAEIKEAMGESGETWIDGEQHK